MTLSLIRSSKKITYFQALAIPSSQAPNASSPAFLPPLEKDFHPKRATNVSATIKTANESARGSASSRKTPFSLLKMENLPNLLAPKIDLFLDFRE